MIYIHIPFCKSRCLYCDFFSSTQSPLQQKFVDSLCNEILLRAEEITHARANTIYIGGGTPSQLTGSQLRQLFTQLSQVVGIGELKSCPEITIEVNPDDITPEFVEELKGTPVNRISMGVQTTDDHLLSLLHRRHTSSQAKQALSTLRQAGYTNISLDLMYGLPGQTMEMWRKDVDTLLSWGIPHLSAYSLQWEEGTALYRMLEQGILSEADEELSLEMYEYLIDTTATSGMQHYEISNFAIPGRQSLHNSGYWTDTPYAGLGPGAHSYDGGRVRKSNPADLQQYCQNKGDVIPETEELTDAELYDEHIMKRLRTQQGIDLTQVPAEYQSHLALSAKPHIQGGRLKEKDGHLCLTRKGIFTSNDIISDLML